MSSTRTVPARVPSDLHSSSPCRPSSAMKNTRSPTTARDDGPLPSPPGQMSLTRTVPALVPSDLHSSVPWTPSSAVKNAVPPTPTRFDGLLGNVRRADPAAVDAPRPVIVRAATTAVATGFPATSRARRRSALAPATFTRAAFTHARRRRRLMTAPPPGNQRQDIGRWTTPDGGARHRSPRSRYPREPLPPAPLPARPGWTRPQPLTSPVSPAGEGLLPNRDRP